MAGNQFGPRNHQWRGGRTRTAAGYWLVRMPHHPMADCRGYVYEHRLVASEKLGRPLRRNEHVHHINGDKGDNRPENLEVLTNALHRAEHRTSGRGRLREPGAPNPTLPCDCGCGATLERFDSQNRPRRFLPGHDHNVGRPAPTRDAILTALAAGQTTVARLVEATGRTRRTLRVALSRLVAAGLAMRTTRGAYALPEKA